MQNINLAYIDSKRSVFKEKGQQSTFHDLLHFTSLFVWHTGDLQSSDQLKAEWLFQQNDYLCFCVLLC